MTSSGAEMRERWAAAMAAIGPGAVLARRRRHWTVVRRISWATSLELVLQHGRRQFHAHVMVSITGPDLREAGLRVVTPPPTKRQRTLFSDRQRDCE